MVRLFSGRVLPRMPKMEPQARGVKDDGEARAVPGDFATMQAICVEDKTTAGRTKHRLHVVLGSNPLI